MSQGDPDILIRTKNISLGAREEAGRLPISSCPQESSKIVYFHFPSLLLKFPKQGIIAFLKPILSIFLSLLFKVFISSEFWQRRENRHSGNSWIVVPQCPTFQTFLITPQLVKLFHLYIYHSNFWDKNNINVLELIIFLTSVILFL